ncbi:MAG: sigma-70 family RNA polymerase sigma factor [Myxococcales bacterium]|nr:sigma-70 family RNA polymerase sigma factor [Myxococcales bacterium]
MVEQQDNSGFDETPPARRASHRLYRAAKFGLAALTWGSLFWIWLFTSIMMILGYPLLFEGSPKGPPSLDPLEVIFGLCLAITLLLITIGRRLSMIVTWLSNRKDQHNTGSDTAPAIAADSLSPPPTRSPKWVRLITPGVLFLVWGVLLFIHEAMNNNSLDAVTFGLAWYFIAYVPYWWLFRVPFTWARWNSRVLSRAKTTPWFAVVIAFVAWPAAVGSAYLTFAPDEEWEQSDGPQQIDELITRGASKWAILLNKVKDSPTTTRVATEFLDSVRQSQSSSNTRDSRIAGAISGRVPPRFADPSGFQNCTGGIGVAACMECLDTNEQKRILKKQGYRIPDDELLGLIVDALIDVCLRYGDDPNRYNLAATLTAVAKNKVLDYLKTGANRFMSCEYRDDQALEWCWSADYPTDYVRFQNEKRLFHRLLCELDDREKEILFLRVAHDWDYQDIANRFGISSDQAKNITNNTIKKLRHLADSRKCNRL